MDETKDIEDLKEKMIEMIKSIDSKPFLEHMYNFIKVAATYWK